MDLKNCSIVHIVTSILAKLELISGIYFLLWELVLLRLDADKLGRVVFPLIDVFVAHELDCLLVPKGPLWS